MNKDCGIACWLSSSVHRKVMMILSVGFAALILGALHIRNIDQERTEASVKSSLREKRKQFDAIISLKTKELVTFVDEWSMWDEMADYIKQPTREWEEYNLDPYLDKMSAEHIMVFDAQWRSKYALATDGTDAEHALTIVRLLQSHRSAIRKPKQFYWYINGHAGLYEVCVSAVTVSSDPDRKKEPIGYFVVMRNWSAGFAESLEALTQSQVRLANIDEPLPIIDPLVAMTQRVDFTLRDINGMPVAKARFVVNNDQALLSAQRSELIFSSVAIGLTALFALIAFGLDRVIVRPLHIMHHALESSSPTALKRLPGYRDEIGELARAIDRSFGQKLELDAMNQELVAVNDELQDAMSKRQEANETLAELMLSLEWKVAERTRDVEMAVEGTIMGWSKAMDRRDKETEGHTQRVTAMAIRLGEAAGMDAASLKQLKYGALLHDIGKVGIPDAILFKQGKLSEEEFEIMKMHTTMAYDMLKGIPIVSECLDIPLHHHEKWDGSGYPHGLKGDEIPFAARLFAIADVWDALRSNRPYRTAWSEEHTREYIAEQAGTHFDPAAVELFLKLAPMPHPSDLETTSHAA